MNITYPAKEADFAELAIDGKPVRFRIPPAIGTHSEVFQALSVDKTLKIARGKEIVAYAHGALVYKKNEWADQKRIRFPTLNYLRFPEVLTIVPMRKEFGDLEGGMLIDSDLEGQIGQGINRQTEVPKDLIGWTETPSKLLVKDKRIFVPFNLWYTDEWNERNGALIGLVGEDGAEMQAKTAKDSGRNYKPLWKVKPKEITSPERRVPVLDGFGDDWLGLMCDSDGDWGGCGVGVLV